MPGEGLAVKNDDHRLEGDDSPAAITPLAQHEDALSPSRALRETSASGGGQRLGDSGPVANPIVSFPSPDEGLGV